MNPLLHPEAPSPAAHRDGVERVLESLGTDSWPQVFIGTFSGYVATVVYDHLRVGHRPHRVAELLPIWIVAIGAVMFLLVVIRRHRYERRTFAGFALVGSSFLAEVLICIAAPGLRTSYSVRYVLSLLVTSGAGLLVVPAMMRVHRLLSTVGIRRPTAREAEARAAEDRARYGWLCDAVSADRRRAACRAMGFTDWMDGFVRFAIPERIANEEFGDTQERVVRHLKIGGKPWMVYVRVLLATLLIVLNAVREVCASFLGKRSS